MWLWSGAILSQNRANFGVTHYREPLYHNVNYKCKIRWMASQSTICHVHESIAWWARRWRKSMALLWQRGVHISILSSLAVALSASLSLLSRTSSWHTCVKKPRSATPHSTRASQNIFSAIKRSCTVFNWFSIIMLGYVGLHCPSASHPLCDSVRCLRQIKSVKAQHVFHPSNKYRIVYFSNIF